MMGQTMEKHELLDSVLDLYNDIESCISGLVHSRLCHDEEMEKKAVSQMETLLVQCQQELDVVADYLEDN